MAKPGITTEDDKFTTQHPFGKSTKVRRSSVSQGKRVEIAEPEEDEEFESTAEEIGLEQLEQPDSCLSRLERQLQM
jgi:hypothetical protein